MPLVKVGGSRKRRIGTCKIVKISPEIEEGQADCGAHVLSYNTDHLNRSCPHTPSCKGLHCAWIRAQTMLVDPGSEEKASDTGADIFPEACVAALATKNGLLTGASFVKLGKVSELLVDGALTPANLHIWLRDIRQRQICHRLRHQSKIQQFCREP